MIDTQSNIGGFGGNPIPIPVVNTNIYNADGTLTANRVVTGGGFSLTFNAQTKIISSSNVGISEAFVVRNFANTQNNFAVNEAGFSSFGGSPINPNYTTVINGTLGASGGLYILRSGIGIPLYVQGGSYNEARSQSVAGWFGETTSASGIWGRATIGIGVKGEATNILGTAGLFIGKTLIISPSASIIDTAFSVRNNTNTLDMLKVLGNGDTAIGNIGNTGARLGVKGVDNSASTYNTLLTNLAGDFLFQLDNDGGLRTNLGNYRQFKFGNDNYFETVGGSAYYRGNGFGYFNVNLIGGINFESTNFGGGQAHASAKVQIESTTQGFRLVPMTATQASAITPSEGLELNVSNTNGTFTSIGKWQYIGGAWVKL